MGRIDNRKILLNRYIIVAYSEIEEFSVYPVTAFEVPEPNK